MERLLVCSTEAKKVFRQYAAMAEWRNDMAREKSSELFYHLSTTVIHSFI